MFEMIKSSCSNTKVACACVIIGVILYMPREFQHQIVSVAAIEEQD
jgi:hypothetical protein